VSEYQDSGRREENIQDEVVRLTAERDRYMAEASERMQTIGRLEAERDTLKRWQGEAVPLLALLWHRCQTAEMVGLCNRLITEAGRGTT
jgi:hypothetical protein